MTNVDQKTCQRIAAKLPAGKRAAAIVTGRSTIDASPEQMQGLDAAALAQASRAATEDQQSSMNRFVSAALAAALGITAGACQQPTATQLNQQNASSRIYLGALSCNVGGSQGYILGGTKQLHCVFLDKNGAAASYVGTINQVGLDIGYTKAVHSIWRVYSLGPDKKADQIGGRYIGENTTVAMGGPQGGGNWLYGGRDKDIALLAAGIVKDNAYNFATGIADMSLTLSQ